MENFEHAWIELLKHPFVMLYFREMIEFCDNAREFMAQDQQNVISIHCKGGKGRTGTMICVWLIECGLFDGAEVITNKSMM